MAIFVLPFDVFFNDNMRMIPNNFSEAFSQVSALAQTFQKNEAHYLSPKYQEAEVRQDFLDKFFVALGWDVLHQTQQNPYEREVRIEKSVMVSGRGKRADYAFYLLPNFAQSKFMVEAKKPSRQLDNPQDYFQTIRYGWNSNNPIAVLTDFEQFRILDSRYKPSIDSALSRSLKKFHYLEYADEAKFAEIYWLFSREAVANGSIEKYVAELPKLRGAKQAKLFATQIIQPVDESFLAELDDYREQLARAFKNKNADLSGEDLTEITQRTLDRLVFIRFLEDKLVEADEVIDNLGSKSGDAWRDFVNEAKRLDKIYNGIIFKPHQILDSESFSPDVKAFEQIRDDFSHKNSPYDFNTIPIHILGSIYERFLGKEIVVSDKRAKVEEKPEVRKAGGVYYTPEYIVKYIVENTIGKLVAGKKPEEIAKLKFADIACGSGSFLLGAFDYLLNFHTEFYTANKTRKADAIKQGLATETIDGTLRLTVQYKREILLNNIFGVDVDSQAVEVAQLSLYLKLLEDETTATKQQYLAGFREQLLPSLDKNIICGNSLIDFDIMSGMLFDAKDFRKLNPMNFQNSFPEVFRNGGFDAIIGNPPWGAEFNEISLEYLRKANNEIIVRMIDSFMYFVYQSYFKIKENGYFGMIIPDVILYQIDNRKLREFILKQSKIDFLLNMGDVFEKVTRPTAIVIFQNSKEIDLAKNKVKIADFSDSSKKEKEEKLLTNPNYELFPQNEFFNIPSTLFVTASPEKYKVWNKIKQIPNQLLNEFVDNDGLQRGVSPDLKKAFVVDSVICNEWNLEKEKIKKVLTGGRQVKRYFTDYQDLLLIYTSQNDNFNNFPNICSYINQFKSEITCKEVLQKKHSIYSLHRSRNQSIFEKPEKLIGVITEDEIILSLDTIQTFVTDGLYLFSAKDGVNIKYLMAILNSKLFVFIYRLLASETGRVLAQVKPTTLAQLPIRQIDFTNQVEKAMHDKVVNLVEQMIEAKQKLATARLDNEKQLLERYCNSLDSQIDGIVYQLYGLTNEEIALVEKG